MSQNNGTSSLAQTQTITLPLSIFQQLLFSRFDELEPIKAQSLCLGDYPAWVKVIPKELGELISSLDPNELYFHIEYYSSSEYAITEWAELWHRKDWNVSNAKIYRSKEASERRVIEYATKNEQSKKRSLLIEELEATLAANPTWRGHPTARHLLAINIADNYKKHDLTEVLKTLDLLETLEEFEQQTDEH